MEQNELAVKIEDIRLLAQKVIDSLWEEKACINLTSDYYWEIPMKERFSLDRPTNESITLGSLHDDWENVKEELRHEDDRIVGWDCELLSRIFMAIGHDILFEQKDNDEDE